MTQTQKDLLKKYNLNSTSKNFKAEIIQKIQELEGEIADKKPVLGFQETVTLQQIESNIVRCPDAKTATKMINLIEKTKEEHDSIGGVIAGIIKNPPVGLGEPEFDKLPSLLAKAMMSINATKGFEIGSGFEGMKLKGSQHNDIFAKSKSSVKVILVDIDGVLSLPFNLDLVLEEEFGILANKNA